MKIVIAGAGEVGSHLAKMLSSEYHEITVVDSDPKRLESIAGMADVIVIEGAGSPAEINLKQDDIVNMGMAKLAKPIKELKAKYKDDPRRVQQETMKLYSEYGINPLAGCFPVLIQIPIFIGLYYMLQTSAEIRFAHFLWIKDLSLPDTIAGLPTIFGMPIHLLPILNAIVTFTQMHITPMPNVDKTQAWMMKLMPLIMLLFFYTFPSGLVLYWLMQSLIGILQAIITRRGIDRVQFKKKTKPGFFQKMQMAMEQAQAAQASRGPEFEKLPLREKMKIIQAENRQAKAKMKEDRLKGTMYEKRKKNPGGRNTPKKDRK